MKESWNQFRQWLAEKFFRIWTATFVLVLFGWALYYRPDITQGWKRAVDQLVQTVCDQIPYPWGARVESTLGNFGLWVQVALAIFLFRSLTSTCRFCWRRWGKKR
jgi:hypothetical protein